MSAPDAALRALEQAFLRHMRAEHPDMHWELIDDPSEPDIATPHDPDPVDDRGPLAA